MAAIRPGYGSGDIEEELKLEKFVKRHRGFRMDRSRLGLEVSDRRRVGKIRTGIACCVPIVAGLPVEAVTNKVLGIRSGQRKGFPASEISFIAMAFVLGEDLAPPEALGSPVGPTNGVGPLLQGPGCRIPFPKLVQVIHIRY